MALETATLQILANIVGGSHVCFDPAVTRRYVGQVGELICVNPDAVVFAGNTGEVSDVVRAAHADVPVIPRYATANAGAAVMLRTASVVLALDRTNQILDLDPPLKASRGSSQPSPQHNSTQPTHSARESIRLRAGPTTTSSGSTTLAHLVTSRAGSG